MTSTVIDRPISPEDADPDGERWAYALDLGPNPETGVEETLLASTATDVVAHLIEGYADIEDTPYGDEEAAVRRAAFAYQVAATIQAMIVSDAISEGALDVEDLDEAHLDALLGDRRLPVVDLDTWDLDVPLVLSTIDYAPHTDLPAPAPGSIKNGQIKNGQSESGTNGQAQVLWVDPADEVDLLRSLAHLGVIRFHTLAD